MRLRHAPRTVFNVQSFLSLALTLVAFTAWGGEPSPTTYWKVDDIKPGMKGTGRTVMVGTKLEEFGAEVLGVMKGVSPGRDMVLCRLTGCNLEHAGIIQGMSGSPIYIDGKLLGAVAFAWEFAKDPIAGVTPFSQMVEYVRSSDRRLATESKEPAENVGKVSSISPLIEGLVASEGLGSEFASTGPLAVSGGALAGMRPIATPLAATGFTPRALALLEERFRPIGLAPMAGGGASQKVIDEEGNKPLAPGSPLSIAMVTGDFDLSGIGTVTHVEGNRVYGFGHPMFSLGTCEFPLMTGYIHTVYPRASVSMKMGSPLKTVGILDTDVSTGVAGRIGPAPDMLPVVVKVKTGRYADLKTYRVQMVREPNLLPSLVMSVLVNAIDTEGNLPEELTAKIKATIRVKGHDPITVDEVLSGSRYTGMMGPTALFSPIGSIVNVIVRNPHAKVRIEAIDADIEIIPGRSVAQLESVRLASDRLEPGETLRAFVTLKPFKGERQTVTVNVPLPKDIEEGPHELAILDSTNSLRRTFRNDPGKLEPRDVESLLNVIRFQTLPRRTALHLHIANSEKGLAVHGQSLPNLPGSARAVFASARKTQDNVVRSDLLQTTETPWVVEGTQSLRFTVFKDSGLSLK